jgi:pimeloyl-ACP methyl ester carboxylesterase
VRTEGFVEVQNGNLWFELAGEGSPIVLIHAGIADSRMWDPQVTLLVTSGWRVLRYDVRGYRKSIGTKGPNPHWHDLLRLLEALNIAHAVLVGSSLGAAIAIDFTLENPAMVRSLVLVSPGLGGYDWQPSIERYGAAILEAARADDTDRIVEEHLRLWVDGRSRQPTSLDGSIRELARDMLHGAITVEDGAQMEPPAIGRLSEIQKPTLILVGAEDLPDVLAIAELLEHGIQGATKVVLPDAAHLLNMERPKEFNELMLSFLASSN